MQSILNPTVSACKAVMLMKNGHLTIGKKSIQTYNTCSFDSLFAMVSALYVDFECVKKEIDPYMAQCKFSKMIAKMFSECDSIAVKRSSLLRMRNQLLFDIFKGSKESSTLSNGLVSINCASNVNYVIQKTSPIHSCVVKKQCDKCGDILISNRYFLDINMDEFEDESIRNLSSILANSIGDKSSKCECSGTRRHTRMFSSFVMVDLHLREHIKEISLDEIPRTLNLDNEYALFGCIEYIGDDISKHLGHYIAHVYRKNQSWETYDDTKSKISRPSLNAHVKAQILFYCKKV